MIDEQQYDLAIEYLFGHIEGDAQREFEAWLESDNALRTLVDELRETTAALALSAPQHSPRPQLRDRILAITRGESTADTPPAARKVGWIPWVIAAGFAIACGAFYADRERWRKEVGSAEGEIARSFATAQSSRDQASKLAEQLLIFQMQTKSHIDQIAELRDEVVKLRGRDALTKVQIASLSAQTAEFGKAGVIIVWDPQEHRGVARLANLPKAEVGKDYQLWIIDPQYPAPVSAGILPVASEAATKVPFKPNQLIDNASQFAITIEQAGGVPKAAGPIIFAGE